MGHVLHYDFHHSGGIFFDLCALSVSVLRKTREIGLLTAIGLGKAKSRQLSACKVSPSGLWVLP